MKVMKKIIVIIALAAIAANAAIAGTITGVVTNQSDGQPIEGLWVYAFDYTTNEYCNCNSTNEDGFYFISGLAAGTYKIWVSTGDSDYIEEYYDNTDYLSATPVMVAAGRVTQNIDFALSSGNIVKGTITDTDGQPISGMQVNAFDYQTSNWQNGGQSDENGNYEIRRLPAGTYRIENDPGQSDYVRQNYDHTYDWQQALPVVINAGSVVENINFQLALGGRITGTVTDSSGQPIPYITVSANGYPNDSYGYGAQTDIDGTYTIRGLPSGQYRVLAWAGGTIYTSKYYDDTILLDNAVPVSVSAGQQTAGIDFSLEQGASISGFVKNSDGIAQANVQVNCWADNGYGTGDMTDENGFYRCDGLPVGYTYNVVAYPPADSGYFITRITVDAYQPSEYANQDITLDEGGLTISGRITDKATGLPLVNVKVGLWNDDLEIWAETRTDADGVYTLTNLPGGEEVDISIEPHSYYAYTGIEEFKLYEDIYNLDFELTRGATLCGKVLAADTAEPLANIKIEYSNENHNADRTAFTNADGTFCLTQLPPGIAEVKAMPNIDSGYAWNLSWPSDWVCISEGEERSGLIIALEKGILVSGYIKDSAGNPFPMEYCYSGKNSDGWADTDANGFYQIRLPAGKYSISPDDDDELGTLPAIVTVTDTTSDINVPDIIVYTDQTGQQISGEVTNPNDSAKAGYFAVIAFEAGTMPDNPNAFYTVQPVTSTDMENAGSFSLTNLPPGVNYDIYLLACYETPDIESAAVRDAVLNVAAGTTALTLEYNSQASTLTGNVKNTDGTPVLGATLFLLGSSGFSGFAETDCSGEYTIYNLPEGTYTVTALHSKYANASTVVNVEGIDTNAGVLIIHFAGSKEGPDLNGDGNVDVFDVSEFAQQWLASGTHDSDFNGDNSVNFSDWIPIADNWLGKAIWR